MQKEKLVGEEDKLSPFEPKLLIPKPIELKANQTAMCCACGCGWFAAGSGSGQGGGAVPQMSKQELVK